MKVLVTGGSGFLGSFIAETLLEQGHDVRALVRKSSNRKFLESLDRMVSESNLHLAASKTQRA